MSRPGGSSNDERPLSILPESPNPESHDIPHVPDLTHRPSDGSIDLLMPPLITRRQGSHATIQSDITQDATAPPTPNASQVHLNVTDDTSSMHTDEDAKDVVSPTTLRIRYGHSVSQPASRAPSIYSRAQSGFSGQPGDLFRRASSARLSVPRRTTLTETPGGAAAFRRPRRSTQLRDEIPKPWLKYKDPAHRYATWIFWGIWVASLCLVAVLCYLGYRSVPSIGRLCVVMDDDFSTGSIDPTNWMHEVRVDGYGNGEFEWTTDSPNNSYIADQTLYIVPTLTGDVIGNDAVTNGYRLNLTADGTCSSDNVTQCVASSNSSLGTIINPVQSARLRSRFKMKYGKIEIVARLPEGDWLTTGIRLLPSDNVYGEWPRSGEIGIVNARGNGPSYPDLGNDNLWSALHWGPFKEFDSYFRSWGIRKDRRNGYTKQFKTYSLEWNEKYLTTYIDNKVQTILDVKFDQDLWTKGDYPAFWQKGADETIRLENPWYSSDNINAPFDQDFELVMGVSVGGTSGQFPDNLGGKPWQDSSVFAMNDFWTARDRWVNTWPENKEDRGLAVKSVKMWRTC